MLLSDGESGILPVGLDLYLSKLEENSILRPNEPLSRPCLLLLPADVIGCLDTAVVETRS